MADKKITELDALTSIANDDLLVIVDATDTTTKKITRANVVNDMIVICLAGNAVVNGATVQRNNEGELEVTLEDNQTQFVDFNAVVPHGATSISSIKILYIRASTGNAYLRFYTCKSATSSVPGATTTDQTDTYTAYAGSSNDGGCDAWTVPAAAYNGLGSVAKGDIIGIDVSRDATSGTDTYNTNLRILGAVFTFA